MNSEVRALLDKARASHEAATLLRREGYLDFAASRAYYALFYVAEALLLERGLSYSSHSAVIAAFGREFARTGDLDPRFHRYLIDAQDLRQVGDYGTGGNVTADQVDELLRWTPDFIVAAEGFLSR
ncbi:MAG: hypothetical protein HW378_4981, partial [Anaerolineales bacterium]|nr:hypothetical protein [Anaerolineales bacterium]